MIQELFGAAAGLVPGESKISINGGGGGGVNVLLQPLPSPSSTTSVTTTTSTATPTVATSATSSNSENQNLRCPRCDSANTKFCYYNNYNLTQPRHFCKTCRRYWTKGGALRNVPIGGGCRKNKSVGMSNAASKTSTTKMKTVVSELGSRPGLGHGFDPQELPPTPILWGSPQNTHLLALLRASQSQNPSPNPNHSHMSIAVKEEGNLMGSQSQMVTEPLISNIGMFSPRTLSYDGGVGPVPSLFWRNNLDHQAQQQNGGFVIGEHHHNSGIQELYHKIRSSSSSTTNYCSDNSPVLFHGHIAASSSSSSSISNILEATSSVTGGDQLGYWNPTLSWSDLPTTNGTAYQ